MSGTARGRISYPGDVEDAMPEGNLARWLATYLIETILRVWGVVAPHAAYANLPIYYVKGDPGRHVSPDAFCLEGVPYDPELESYELWETGVPPCVVFEIVSKGREKKDRVKNRGVYAELGIEEYYWFDPRRVKLVALRLDRDRGRYVEIRPDLSGRFQSPNLGLEVGIEGKLLALYRLGEYLPPTAELLRIREEALVKLERELAEERRRREELERRLRELEDRGSA